MKVLKVLLCSCLMLLLVFSFVGCGGSSSDSDASQATAGVESTASADQDATASAPATDVAAPSAAVELPAAYPKDIIPVMTDATLQVAMEDGTDSYTVSFTTPSAASAVVDFYKNAFSKYSDTLKVTDTTQVKAVADGYNVTIDIDGSSSPTSVRISTYK